MYYIEHCFVTDRQYLLIIGGKKLLVVARSNLRSTVVGVTKPTCS